MIEKGKESEFPEGRGGGKGSGIRNADSDDRGVPPIFDITRIAININTRLLRSLARLFF